MVNYKKSSIEKLSGGYGAAKVFKVKEEGTGEEFVLKQGSEHQNVQAVLVSQFLKHVLDDVPISMQGQQFRFYTPTVSIDHDLEGNVVQKQEFLRNLSSNVNGKKIQGLASLDTIREAAKIGAIYQFLMLGDNISHNNRISPDGKFNIFDFDSAFILGGKCVTSPEGIFHDHVVSVHHAYNDHFIDILALRMNKDKYHYINFGQAAINDFGTETWGDFFLGVKEGLELIKAKITEDFLHNQWGKGIPVKNQDYLAQITQLVTARLDSLDKNIKFLDEVLTQQRVIPGIDINGYIKDTLGQQANISQYVSDLKKAIVAEIDKPVPDEKQYMEKGQRNRLFFKLNQEQVKAVDQPSNVADQDNLKKSKPL